MKRVFKSALLFLLMLSLLCSVACNKNVNHNLEHIDYVPATCTQNGLVEHWRCLECDQIFLDENATKKAEKSDLIVRAVSHTPQFVEKTEPNCNYGYDEHWACSTCGEVYSDESAEARVSIREFRIDPVAAHSFQNGACTVCGMKVPYTLFEDENGVTTVLLGTYPQSIVEDATLVTTLNSIGTAQTRIEIEKGSNRFSYIDVTYQGQKYRQITYHGAQKELTEWFRFDPIEWGLLVTENGEYTLLCKQVLDKEYFQKNAVYDETDGRWYIDAPNVPKETLATSFEYSNIRTWLTETFYDTAFTDDEYTVMQSFSESYNDKVKILSKEEWDDYFYNTSFLGIFPPSDYAYFLSCNYIDTQTLLPDIIERTDFETKILAPLTAAHERGDITTKDFIIFKETFRDYFYTDPDMSSAKKNSIAKAYPITAKKNIDIYTLDSINAVGTLRERLEEIIRTYTDFTYQDLLDVYEKVEYHPVYGYYGRNSASFVVSSEAADFGFEEYRVHLNYWDPCIQNTLPISGFFSIAPVIKITK